MRKNIVAGNWKMNLNLEEAKSLAGELKAKLDQLKTGLVGDNRSIPEVILFPPYVYVTRILDLFPNYQGLSVGAQNCHHEDHGAFTGEVSAHMIRSVGATHVIIGHSERRSQFGEVDLLLAEKVKQALKHGLTPVFCCGEMLPERENGNHFQVVADQLQKGLFWLDKAQLGRVVVAYEPVWAIGTGVTATPAQAQEMHAYIRQLLSDTYGEAIAQQTSLLYGGSCNAKNAAELFSQPDVDGGLIGGASLKADDFFRIIQSF
ncbi:MAG: triose-phosphate isomerase [Bacteroidia bacterium]|nr:MAG: triose-phosphate isomerase [Bacteroidia bacterium]